LLAQARERVFYVGTFSKILCPGLRVGWLVVPHRFRQRARDLKQGVDLQSSSLSQAIVEDYLVGSAAQPGIDLEARLIRLRQFYQRRAVSMARAIRRHIPSWSFDEPVGGFAIWVDTHAAISEADFLRAAIEEGVVFDPGSLFRPADSASGQLSLRLCFSYSRPAAFDVGLQRLARAWARSARSRTIGPGGRVALPKD
jgi:2-aminoadipate transaminase